MSNDLISREALRNALLDSRPDNIEQTDINFDTCDIKIWLSFVLKIIDNAPTVTPEKALMHKLKGGEGMTCKDCIHSGLCYKENEYDNFPDRCGDFVPERLPEEVSCSLCETCKNSKNCNSSDKGLSFANHSICWKYEKGDEGNDR